MHGEHDDAIVYMARETDAKIHQMCVSVNAKQNVDDVKHKQIVHTHTQLKRMSMF